MGDQVVSKVDFSNPSAAVFRDVSPMPTVEPAEQQRFKVVNAVRVYQTIRKEEDEDDGVTLCADCGNALLCVCDRRPVIKLSILDTRFHATDPHTVHTQFWVQLTFPGSFATRDCTLWNNEQTARERARYIANTEPAFRFVIDDGPSQPS